MIRFTEHTNNAEEAECHFIHANGFPPNAYNSFLNLLSNKLKIKSPLLSPHWEDDVGLNSFNDWDIFLDDFLTYCNENNISNSYGIGHSIGGNILLRASLANSQLFKSIILLDPTIFVPSILSLWKLVSYIPFIKSSFPLAKAAKNRRIIFDNLDHIFASYRKKKIFSKIPQKELKEYINSIFNYNEKTNSYELNFNRIWEQRIYLTSVFKDLEIWNNINKLKIPTLLIIPEYSPVLRKSAAKKLSSNKNITIKIIDDSSHLFPLEKSTLTSNLILKFFKF